jgi:hypothetical protein
MDRTMSDSNESTPDRAQGEKPKSPVRSKATRKKTAPPKVDRVSTSVGATGTKKKASKKKSSKRTQTAGPSVRLVNQLGQLLEVTILNEEGQQVGVRLGPNAVTEPILSTHLTDYTQRLIGRGYLSITNS